ncbi:MAG: FKBP-type peptidyl-prolyl cis-trans isomerase [Pseudomonadota bacterium]
MTKTPIALALVLASTLTACNKAPAPAPQELTLETNEQRISYGMAYRLGSGIEAEGIPLDLAAFNAGIRDATEGAEARITPEEVETAMRTFQSERAAQASGENSAQGDAFRAENANAEGVETTASGLQYKVLTAGDGPLPGPTDVVNVHYRGTLVDGTEFDSSYSRGEPTSFGLNQVIPGWSEGLQLMPVGSKYQFVIPPELGYGAGGAGGVIGPNATLVFEVELLNIESAAQDAADETAKSES